MQCLQSYINHIHIYIQYIYFRNIYVRTSHPVDHSRVVLSVPDENESDYINASYIDVRKLPLIV